MSKLVNKILEVSLNSPLLSTSRNNIKKAISWTATTKSLDVPRKLTSVLFDHAILARNGTVLYYNDPGRAKVIALIKKIKEEIKVLMEINEAYQIYMAVKATEKVKGDIAEVGVYKGGSAKIICEAKGKKKLFLFDTFEGLPEISKKDEQGYFHKGEFLVNVEDVKKYLKKYKDVYFYKGLFPDTAKPIMKKTFSFVNLDVDIYESTKSCLEFFYPRMNKGGIIISHDYINAIGVRKAFDEFFKNKPEVVLEMSGSQCLVVKV